MREAILINFFCIVVALGGLVVIAWAILSGRIATEGLDAIFLIFVALTGVALFSIIPLQAVRRGEFLGLLKKLSRRREKRNEQQRVHA